MYVSINDGHTMRDFEAMAKKHNKKTKYYALQKRTI